MAKDLAWLPRRMDSTGKTMVMSGMRECACSVPSEQPECLTATKMFRYIKRSSKKKVRDLLCFALLANMCC